MALFNSSCDHIAFTRYAGKIKTGGKKKPKKTGLFVYRDTFSHGGLSASSFRDQARHHSLLRPAMRLRPGSVFLLTAYKQRLWSSSPGILAALQVQHPSPGPFICPAPTSTASPASLSPSFQGNSSTLRPARTILYLGLQHGWFPFIPKKLYLKIYALQQGII